MMRNWWGTALAVALAAAAPGSGERSGRAPGPDRSEERAPADAEDAAPGRGAAPARKDEAPKSPARQRAERILAAMEARGVLRGSTIRWSGEDFRVKGAYRLCESFAGVCFEALRAGNDAPVVVAAYEDEVEGIGLEVVEWEAFRRASSQDAVRHFMKKGAKMSTVFQLVDAAGAPLFDAAGMLTPAGEAVYQRSLAGRPASWTLPGQGLTDEQAKAEAKRKGVAWGDPEQAEARMKELKGKGFFEVTMSELNCLEKLGWKDRELNLAPVRQRTVTRFFVQDDPYKTVSLIVKQKRKTGRCNPSEMRIIPR